MHHGGEVMTLGAVPGQIAFAVRKHRDQGSAGFLLFIHFKTPQNGATLGCVFNSLPFFRDSLIDILLGLFPQ